MNNKIKYPILNWSYPEYWGKIFVFLVFIIMYKTISYNFLSKQLSIYELLAYLQILLIYAVHERQKLLLQYIDAIKAITEDDIIKKLIFTNDIDRYKLPSWGSYWNKLKKLGIHFCNFLLIFFIVIFLLVHNKNLAFKIGSAPSLIFLYIWYYIKAIYLRDYLKKIIKTNIAILSTTGTDIASLEMTWGKYNKKIITDRIISALIVFLAVILYFLNFIDLFYGIVTLIWFAFLYPSIRLTIDLNFVFNRFSLSIEKEISDLLIKKENIQ
jgi:hypothetical protein